MLQSIATEAERFAVIDVETTGVLNADRIVEVAVVTLDRYGRVIDEWDTLVDPQRDVGPVHLHGITASMVSAAPTFDGIAAALAERVYGSVLVSHNTPFDFRMLSNEFDRLGAQLHPGDGVCTLRLSGAKLMDACRRHSVTLHHEHRALADARACASLLQAVVQSCTATPASVWGVSSAYNSRTLRRETVAADVPPMPYLARLTARAHHYGVNGAALAYLDMLDWALSDLVLTVEEVAMLRDLAQRGGLPLDQLEAVHRGYLDELIAAAVRDEIVTDEEMYLLETCARLLGIDSAYVAAAVEQYRPGPGRDVVRLTPGLRVCFTGSATHPDGTELRRADLSAIAVDLGLDVMPKFTRRDCDLLVAADPNSSSGKARQARRWGVPVAAVSAVLAAQPGSFVPVS